jgi:hypothetical protein
MKTFLFFLLFPIVIYAQTGIKYTIKGTIVNTKNIPVEYATITVLTPDSIPATGTVANEEGKFIVKEIASENYILAVTHLSHQPAYIDVIVSDNLQLPPIVLSENVNLLNEIAVTINFIQYKADRYEISLQGNPITKGHTAASVLEWMPGIYKQNSILKIYGKTLSRFYVDNRPASKKELEAIQADMIDKIEIIHTPGSESGASNTSGIVKIKLKKIPEGGFYGSLAGSLALNPTYGYMNDNTYSVFNYRYKKWSFYNYINYSNYRNNNYLHEESIYQDLNQRINMRSQDNGKINSFFEKLSLACDISKKQSVGVNISIFLNNFSPLYQSQSEVFDAENIAVSSATNMKGKSHNTQYQSALNYDCQIDDKGSNFRLIADYLRRYNDNNRNYEYLFDTLSLSPVLEYRDNDNNQKIDMFTANAKFEIKLGKIHQLDFGGTFYLDKRNQLLTYRYWDYHSWFSDENLTDSYNLKSSSYAAYVSFASAIGQLMYKVGVRAQGDEISYDSHKIGKQNSKFYFGFYPTISATYPINQRQGSVLNFSYRRSMNDIPYSAISPVITYNNEYSYTKGNLNIEPPVYNALSLNLTLKKKWSFYFTFLTGQGAVRYTTLIDENNPIMSYKMPVNSGKSTGYLFGGNGEVKITNWWTSKASVNITWDKTEKEEYFQEETKQWRYYFSLNNNFRFEKGWGSNLYLYDEPTFKSAELTYLTVYGISGSIYKYLLKDRLQISANFVFYAKSRNLITERLAYWSKRSNMTDTKGVTIRITYNFKQGKSVRIKQSQTIQTYQELKDD